MMTAYVAADTSIKDDYLPHIKLLFKQVRELYKKRHQVAHFMVVGRQVDTGPIHHVLKPFFTVDAFQQRRGTELTLEQIVQRVGKIGDLCDLVRRHIQHVGALRKLPVEHYVRAGDRAFPPLRSEDPRTPCGPSE
jgi:hypothetical protein